MKRIDIELKLKELKAKNEYFSNKIKENEEKLKETDSYIEALWKDRNYEYLIASKGIVFPFTESYKECPIFNKNLNEKDFYIGNNQVKKYENDVVTLKKGIVQYEFDYRNNKYILNVEDVKINNSSMKFVKVLNCFKLEEY